MSESIVKRQHYVPNFYLKNFSDDKENILAKNINNKNEIKIKTKNIAINKYFYDIEKADNLQQRQAIEKGLSLLENKASVVINRIINLCSIKRNLFFSLITSSDERYLLAEYIALQMLRTPKYREWINKFNYKLHKKRLKLLVNYINHKKNTNIDYNDIDIIVDEKIGHLDVLIDVKYISFIAEVIYSSNWIFFYNDTNIPFLTSDNPAIRIPSIGKETELIFGNGEIKSKHELKFNSFLETDDWYIHFPLNPNVAIGIFKEGISGYETMKKFRNRCCPIKEHDVKMKNTILAGLAHEWIFMFPDKMKFNNKIKEEHFFKIKAPIL